MQTFFSAGGRAGRLRFAVVLLVSAVLLGSALLLSFDHLPVAIFVALVWGVVLAKFAAECGRRLHDLGIGAHAGVFAAAAIVAVLLWCAFRTTYDYRATMLPAYGVAALGLLPLLLLSGRREPNAFGEVPYGLAATSPVRPVQLAILTPVLMVVATEALVLGAFALDDALRREHERHRGDTMAPSDVEQNIYADPPPVGNGT